MEDAPFSIKQLRIEQEVLLHAALYRAAYASNVGGQDRFVLEPATEDQPPELGVEPEVFRQRVLEHLMDLHVAIAWRELGWSERAADLFPGTGERATRLLIRIERRDPDSATIVAEISDQTASAPSSRQRVRAEWDGQRWVITRDPVRLVW